MTEDISRIYEQAALAKESGAVGLGLASFLPLVEEGLEAAFSSLPPEEQVQAIYRFRQHLVPPTGKDLRQAIKACRRCPNLVRPVVVGEGKYTQPRIAFYAEMPGEIEHQQNRPLVGPAGTLFRSCLAAAGIPEDEVWLSNSVRCWATGEGNQSFRKPTKEESANCKNWLFAEIEVMAPQLIVLLGSVALNAVFPGLQIMKTRGEVKRIGIYSFLPSVHPSWVLRDMSKRHILEADLKLAASLTRPGPGNAQENG